MADFGFAGSSAVINGAINHQPPADSASECRVKNRVAPLPRAQKGFAKTRDVCVVVDAHGRTHQIAKPRTEIEVRPSFDLVRTTNFSRAPINGPAEADTGSLNFVGTNELRDRDANLFPNAFAAP